MQPEKVQTIQGWKIPAKLTDVCTFLGFTNFYRRFIHGFSSTVRPLTELTRKDQRFHWDRDQQLAFEKLKRRFTSAPIRCDRGHGREAAVRVRGYELIFCSA